MPSTQLARLWEDQANESKGQKEDLQATLANMHLKKFKDKGSLFLLGKEDKGN